MSKDILYAISYGPDEITIVETSCKQQWNCTCNSKANEVKCGYSIEEAKQKIIQYYEHRASFLKRCSTDEFLRDVGIYID